MADIATLIISGSLAVVGCFGAVWLKAYLQRRGQGRVSQLTPSDRTAVSSYTHGPFFTGESLPPAPLYADEGPRSRLRPLFIALIGFAAGIASCLLAPLFSPKSSDIEMLLFGVLLLLVLLAVIHHGRSSLPRGLVIFQLEVLSLWAAFAFGGSLAHGFIIPWRGYLEDALAGWLVSEVAGLFLIPLVRRLPQRTA
jgi:hypothetical protein